MPRLENLRQANEYDRIAHSSFQWETRNVKISFTKGRGKIDRMTIHRDGANETLDCPKQSEPCHEE